MSFSLTESLKKKKEIYSEKIVQNINGVSITILKGFNKP